MKRDLTLFDHKRTLGAVIDQSGGSTSGFDYLRIGLAVAVVLWHGILATRGYGDDVWRGVFRPLPAIILPMFFVLSGFLVAGSLQRTASIREFLMLRAIRIVPALFVEVLLSAFILGALLTTLPLSEYFTSPGFFAYFLNIVGVVHFYLPGLFENNPARGVVNLSLWTLPFELYCYIALSIAALIGIVRKPILFLFVSCVGLVVATLMIIPIAEIQQSLSPTGKNLVLSFLFGVILYSLKDRIPRSRNLFLFSLLLAIVLLFKAWTQYLAIPAIAYVTVYMGLYNPPKKSFLLRGDYSYGLYLFAFPMQQLHAYLFSPGPSWLGNVSFSLAMGLLYAYFSWNVVERPILMRKKSIITRANYFFDPIGNVLASLKFFRRTNE